MCAQPMRSSHSCCIYPSQAIAQVGARCARASARCTRAIARCVRSLALAARGPALASCTRQRMLCALASARLVRASARCARHRRWAQHSWHASLRSLRARLRALARGSARCGAARLLPTRDCRALPSPMPIRPLLIAHDTRQGCCLVLVHHALAHCIRAAWATSSLARRHMPALYNTP